MSRQWGGRGRGLGEDQGPVTRPLHAVKRLSAAGSRQSHCRNTDKFPPSALSSINIQRTHVYTLVTLVI